MKELIIGGKRSGSVGRECVTPRVARVDRTGKGQYSITRSDGSHNMIYDEVEAANWRDALIKWYDTKLDNTTVAYDNLAKISINRNAVKAIARAIKNDGIITISATSGGIVDTPVGPAELDDLFAVAQIMGYFAETHSRGCIRWLVISVNKSDMGKIKAGLSKEAI
jgi:hypothetical protein